MAGVGMSGFAFGETRWATPIRELGLHIEGSPLEPLIRQIEGELAERGLLVRPRFYLSTEWGVPTDTIAVAIPLYLASDALTDLQREHVGLVEGQGAADILKYLRHEVGHAVGYAYKLYEQPEWTSLFGAMTQPYVEEYRPSPFSQRYVHHLPGWYAQKHPDEDWAETFAVWLTPGRDWRSEYEAWPEALRKLEYCARTMEALRDVPPPVVSSELDLDVAEIHDTIEQFYQPAPFDLDLPAGLDGSLSAIFDSGPNLQPVADLLARIEHRLSASVYRWTGHFPERTRLLLRALAARARALGLGYGDERNAVMEVTGLVTALAMNHVLRGSYAP